MHFYSASSYIAPVWQNRTHAVNCIKLFTSYFFFLFWKFSADQFYQGQTLVSKCQSFTETHHTARNKWLLMPSQTRRRSPGSMGFREVFKDKSIHRIKVIFWALISSPKFISKYHLLHSLLSALFISKINTFFFLPWSDSGTLFAVLCPESSASFRMWKIWRNG